MGWYCISWYIYIWHVRKTTWLLQRIGCRENLQENRKAPFFSWENRWKIDGFRFRFSLKPIHWLLLLWRSVRWAIASSQAEGLKGASRSFRRAAGRMSSGHYSSNVFFKGGWLMDFWWLIDRFFLLEFSIEKSDCEWWCISDFFLDCLLVTSVTCEKPEKPPSASSA